jgi:ketosteroid isomerase-like protein
MRQARVFSSCGLMFLMSACSPRGRDADSSSGQPATRAALDTARSAFSRAFATGDSTAFDSLFIDDATIDMAGMDPEPLRGASGVRAFAQRVVSDKAPTGPSFTPDSVQLDGAAPRESGQWSWAPGSQATQGSYTIVWSLDPSGRWRLAKYHFTMR